MPKGSMRYVDIRKHVQAVFRAQLERRLAEIDDKGPQEVFASDAANMTRELLQERAENYWDIVGVEEQDRELRRFSEASGLPLSDVMSNRERILPEIHQALTSFVAELDGRRKGFERFDLTASSPPAARTMETEDRADESGATLEEAIEAYLAENKRVGTWVGRTYAKKEATLRTLVELLNGDTQIGGISKKHAQDVKAVLLELPANKNKNAATRDLSLRDAAKVAGIEKLSPETVNGYLSIFHSFFDWAVKNGYTSDNVFVGMKVGKKRKTAADPARTAFPAEAINKMVHELTRSDSELVKKDGYRWASLLGVFTGARRNEICSLQLSDVLEKDGVGCISINDDDPDGRKSLKTAAARRLVPLHSRLLEVGFLDYVERVRSVRGQESRLFPEFPFSVKHGYGRNQGRWFNDKFLPALGLKTEQLAFHSLRHTMVTRLQQAGVPQPLVQTLVGHEREGVTQQVYFGEGYTVAQLKEAIERYSVE